MTQCPSCNLHDLEGRYCSQCKVTHDEECIRDFERGLPRAKAYEQQWPHYCRQCDGWGGKPYGGSYWEPPDFDDCPNCMEKGICPRCGGSIATEEDPDDIKEQCGHCGWDGQHVDDGHPGLPGCWCNVQEDIGEHV